MQVEDVKDVVVSELEVFVYSEEVLHGRDHVVCDEGNKSEIHSYIEESGSYPLKFLNKTIIKQLKPEEKRLAFVAMLSHVIEGEPRTIDPSSTLP